MLIYIFLSIYLKVLPNLFKILHFIYFLASCITKRERERESEIDRKREEERKRKGEVAEKSTVKKKKKDS